MLVAFAKVSSCWMIVVDLTLVVVVFAPPALALVASLTTNWRRRIVSAFSAARNTSEFKVLDLFIWSAFV